MCRYVQNIQQSISQSQQKNQAEQSRKEKKKAEQERQRELDELFAMTIKQPKVPAGVDPKSIVCEFFRHGKCTKSFKCKFSHDLSVERKGHKLDIYSDKRDKEDQDDNMEDWDQETLEKAIAQKHGSENLNRPTNIVCRYFLDAVEKRQYGWFWQCPNGKDCKYRHALPQGFVLKSQMKQLLEEESANKITVEEEIEEERAKVDAQTPITEEVFMKWKGELDLARKKEMEAKEAERKKRGQMTGREIFEQEGFTATDDASASDSYAREIDEEEEIKRMHEQAQKDAETVRSQQNESMKVAEDSGIFDDSDEDDVLDVLAADISKHSLG